MRAPILVIGKRRVRLKRSYHRGGYFAVLATGGIPDGAGGMGYHYVLAEVVGVHTHKCAATKFGKKSGPCNCGAEALLRKTLGEKARPRS